MKRLLLTFFYFLLIAFTQQTFATIIQSTAAGGDWNTASSWSPAQVPVAGDNVTILGTASITVSANDACAILTINTGGQLALTGGNLTVSGSCTINGFLNCHTGYILQGAATLTINSGALIGIGDANGITTGNASGATAGSIQTTGNARSFPSGASYLYVGNVNQVTGNGLPTTINSGAIFSIANTGVAPNNVVTLSSVVANNFQNITLASGVLSLNGKTIAVNGLILNAGGNLATTGAGGSDGGSFTLNGATITGPTIFYNATCLGGNTTITTSGLNAPLIDGTLNIPGSARFATANSPRYAKGSTLSYAGGPNNRGTEWNADLSTTPTIGLTQGYPDNVFINSGSDFDICNYASNGNDGAIPRGLDGNLTTSEFTMIDWIDYNNSAGPDYHNPQLLQTGSFTVGGNMIVNSGGNINMALIGGSGAVTIKGSLTINGAGANVDLDSMTNVFSVGQGIVLNNGTINVGYTGVASKLYVTGDVIQNGGTINDQSGVFSLTGNFSKTGGTFNGLAGTMEFNKAIGSQTFTTNNASETFNNLIVNEPTGGLTLLQNLNLTGDLTLTNGLVLPGATTFAMINGSANVFQTNGWVSGLLQRNISTVGKAYIFPIGDATHYTPVTLTFASVATAGNVKVGTFAPFTGISGYATYALSKTKYVDRVWTLSKSSGSFGTYTGVFDYGTTNLVGGATVANLHTGVYDGASWTYPSATGAGTAVTATAITPLLGTSFVGLSECMYPTAYNVSGGGSYCTGGTGVVVGLNNSQAGVNYQLQIGGVNTGAVVAGTGSAISFGNQTATGTYTVNATNAVTGCPTAMNASAVVSTVAAPVVTFTTSPGANSCLNTDITYATQAGQTNYTWNVPGVAGTNYTIISGGISATDSTVTLQWLMPGSKTVTVNYSNGTCSAATPATSSTTVNNAFPPTFTGTPPSDICVGSTVNYATQLGKTNYTWTVPGILGTDYSIVSGGTGSTNAFVNLTWLSTGSKTVTVNYTGSGCSTSPATNTSTVDPLPVPTFAASPSGNVCENTNETYTTQAGQFNYAWTVPGTSGTDYTITAGGISTTDNTVTLKWLTSGSKTVTVNYANPVTFCTGTAASSSVTVNALPAPTITPSPSANTCAGSNITYTTETGMGSSYLWNVSGIAGTDYMIISGGTTTDDAITIKWLTAGGKAVTVNYTNGGGCTAVNSTSSPTIVSAPQSAIFNAISSLCKGSVAPALPTISTNGITGSWNPAVINTHDTGIVHEVFTPDAGQCAAFYSMDIMITDTPFVTGYPAQINLMQGYPVFIRGAIPDSNAVTIAWSPDNGTISNATIQNPEVTPLADQLYTMVVTYASGSCSSTVNVFVKILKTIGVANVFSPNGDHIHDTWFIKNIEQYPTAEIKVFNRYGQIVYQAEGSNSLQSQWDGTMNGSPLPVGAYYYVIQLNDGEPVYTGSVTIVR